MEMKQGIWRRAIIFERLVVKIPKVTLGEIGSLIVSLGRCRYRDTKQWVRIISEKVLKASSDNWSEYRCWKSLKATFLVPTYFSVGILNIQKRCRGETLTQEEGAAIWSELHHRIGGQEMNKTYRHAFRRQNFLRTKSHYKLVDYGESKRHQTEILLTDFIEKYQNIFQEVLSIK